MGRRKRERQILGERPNSLKNRGVEDIFIACTDNLTGLDAAIHATFPRQRFRTAFLSDARFRQVCVLQGLKGTHGRPEGGICRR